MAKNKSTPVQEVAAPVASDEPKTVKSIVPSKYAGKYKRGSGDAVATFIEKQSGDDKGVFSFDRFFGLATANEIAAEKVSHYKGQVDAKLNGAAGRARMTLGNMLRSLARKNGKLKGNDGKSHTLEVAPLPTREKASETAKAA